MLLQVGEIGQTLEATAKGPGGVVGKDPADSPPRMLIYSAHDSTIMTIMAGQLLSILWYTKDGMGPAN